MLWLLPFLTLSLALAAPAPSPDPPPFPVPSLPGHFLPFSKLSQCPKLAPRPYPTSARDVRPDDIRVMMALGDSITAGFLARPPGAEPMPWPHPESQAVFPNLDLPLTLQEYRGLSYPIGSDPSALTLPTILTNFLPPSINLTGPSTGHRPPTGSLHLPSDGLNAAISGSLASSLVSQVRDYLLPALLLLGDQVRHDDWKYVNVGIGANDICAFCLAGEEGVGSPEEFKRSIREAVEMLRKEAGRVVVNVVGMLKVSDLFKKTKGDPYCANVLTPTVPHFQIECSCALLPGPGGAVFRRKMDELGEAYDAAVRDLVREWQEEDDDSFGAIWQPGSMLDLLNWPIEALSPVDCFHPSEAGHQRVAAGAWNRLSMPLILKATPIKWEDEVMVRCLEEDDRLSTGYFP